MSNTLTILIPTFNESRNIRAAIECARFADEILVVDSFSTDGTADMARELGARVLEHEYVNSATQKNWAIPQAACDWVMILDADERIPPELQQEIRDFVDHPAGDEGLRIYRASLLMGEPIR
jgi:glycosyltransferase involved in cell wall biosynthesis